MSSSSSALRLDPLWADGLVVQQQHAARLGGWDQPGQRVRVHFRDFIHTATADASGRWELRLPTGPAGGPFDLTVEGRSRRVVREVLVGEVWLCSGQSNMEWRLNQCPQAGEDMATAQDAGLHFCVLQQETAQQPREEATPVWQSLSPATAPQLSAVAFYFARRLRAELKVPVGLIVSAWGGTPAEAWIPAPAYASTAATRRIMDEFVKSAGQLGERARVEAAKVAAWEAEHLPADPGNTGLGQGWADAEFDHARWPVMQVPNFWQTHPGLNFNGVLWFRRTVDLPPSWRGQDLVLHLGALDDFDDTYANGERIGGMDRSIPDAFQRPRIYPIPARLTTRGQVSVAVRIFDHYGLGGFRAQPEELRLVNPRPGETPLPLRGAWHYQVEHRLPPLPPDLFATRPYMPPGLVPQDRPAHVYNAMIHPLRRWTPRGVLWYQGESNSGRAGEYADLLNALFSGWRTAFEQPDLPFLLVQLPNYSAGGDWPLLREAQSKARQWAPASVAVTLDIGDTVDIHPLRKQPVGERLAGLALQDVYGRPVSAHSPELLAWKRTREGVAVHFQRADEGLETTDQQAPRAFEVCGPDGVYQPAHAALAGAWVELTHPEKADIHGVRYAFSADPHVNLVNRQQLPAAPFRLDPPALANASATQRN